jgi:ribosomal protein S18 acetylase RimI-like enzyme
MATVELGPMSDDAYAVWRARTVPEYAAEHVASGRWTEEESLARSEREFDELLPNGRSTPGQYLWTIRAGDSEEVGVLWVALVERRPGHAFIYDIWIAPERRGAGFGSAALAALEEWARANGVTSIGLHVFGHNDGARQLYRRIGYVETNIQMEKQL